MNALLFLGKAVAPAVIERLSRHFARIDILAADAVAVPEVANLQTHRYRDFHDNGTVELDALELGRAGSPLQVFGVSEGDMLRVGALNDLLGLSAFSYQDARTFRDKICMKQVAKAAGIPVPAYTAVSVPFDLVSFVERHGYPVVFKPVSGSGGTGTHVLCDRDDLARLLISSLFSYKEIAPTHLVETFVAGDMYHIDGLVVAGEMALPVVSRYYNSCLSFQHGDSLGGYMLGADNVLRTRLLEVTAKVATSFRFDRVSAFHLEVFHTPEDELVFCEVACRAGGGAIMDACAAACGFRYDELALLGAVDRRFIDQAAQDHARSPCLGGYLQVPPRAGRLRRMPGALPFDWIASYLPNAEVGRCYQAGTKCADNILQAVVLGNSEHEVAERLAELDAWLQEEIDWDCEHA